MKTWQFICEGCTVDIDIPEGSTVKFFGPDGQVVFVMHKVEMIQRVELHQQGA